MTVEHVGEGLLALLRGDLAVRAGFVRDLEQATGQRVTEVSVEYRDGTAFRVEIEIARR